jgi:hypothetical protein
MKLSKKLAFLGAAALLATAVFVGCTEEDDDEAGAISGSGKKYSVNYTNEKTASTESDGVYRAYKTAGTRHLGALVKITIKNQETDSHDGNMGFIWDLKQSKDAASVVEGSTTTAPAVTEKGPRNFFAFGCQWQKGLGFRYYVSRYFNVTNIQDKNFGATTKVTTYKDGILATEPKEIAVQDWKELSDVKINSDKTVIVWADIYPVFNGSKYGVPYAETACATDDQNGYWIVDLYDSDPTKDGANKLDSVIIDSSVTGYTAKPAQASAGVYMNVQPQSTLTGAWDFSNFYAEAEVVEE